MTVTTIATAAIARLPNQVFNASAPEVGSYEISPSVHPTLMLRRCELSGQNHCGSIHPPEVCAMLSARFDNREGGFRDGLHVDEK